MAKLNSIAELVSQGKSGASAITAPEGAPPLSYGKLQLLSSRTLAALNALGIGRDDRVAIVLPNGPEMAAAFIAIAASATTAPLNPGYRADEFEFYLTDLRAKALVLESGSDSPARAVARKLSVPVLELVPERAEGAGYFSITAMAPMRGSPVRGGPAGADDTALVLHTSGTTSRPKIVPLLQRNVLASAAHIGATLSLSADDICLNIMPLFHIHGLIAATLASLAAGAQVCCTPGFNALKFFTWFSEVRPTWYTAVPTMHQAILARADRNSEALSRSRLRFIRSSSASLPPQVDGGTGARLRRAGHRKLWNDRSCPPDGLQSPAPPAAQARLRRRRGGPGNRHP